MSQGVADDISMEQDTAVDTKKVTARAERFRVTGIKDESFLLRPSPNLLPPFLGLSRDPQRELRVCFLYLEDGTIGQVYLAVQTLQVIFLGCTNW